MSCEDKSGTHLHKSMTLKAYRKMKLKILKRDFCVYLTEEELAHADTLTTKTQIDQFCIGMLDKYWG